MSAKNNSYGAISITVKDDSPSGKRKQLHDKHLESFKHDLTRRMSDAEKSIRGFIQTELTKPQSEIGRAIKIKEFANSEWLDLYVYNRVANKKFYPFAVTVRESKEHSTLYLCLNPEVDTSDIDEDLLKQNPARKATVEMYEKHKTRYSEKLNKLEEDITGKITAGIEEALKVKSDIPEIEVLAIPAAEYFDEDTKIARLRAHARHFSAWELSAFDHVKADGCTYDERTGKGRCAQGCTFSMMLALQKGDYDDEYAVLAPDLGDDEEDD